MNDVLVTTDYPGDEADAVLAAAGYRVRRRVGARGADLVVALRGVTGAIVAHDPFTADVLERVPELRAVVRRFHCGLCERKMRGTTIRKNVYYRGTARTLAPGSPALADHPRTVNVREDQVLGSLNVWMGSLFAPEHVDETVSRLLSSQDGASDGQRQGERLKARVTDAETRLRRHRAAIEAGVDPAALVEVINDAQSEREAARAELDSIAEPGTLTDAEIYAMIDSLGDVGATLEWLADVLPPDGASGVAQGCSTVSRRASSVKAASR